MLLVSSAVAVLAAATAAAGDPTGPSCSASKPCISPGTFQTLSLSVCLCLSLSLSLSLSLVPGPLCACARACAVCEGARACMSNSLPSDLPPLSL